MQLLTLRRSRLCNNHQGLGCQTLWAEWQLEIRCKHRKRSKSRLSMIYYAGSTSTMRRVKSVLREWLELKIAQWDAGKMQNLTQFTKSIKVFRLMSTSPVTWRTYSSRTEEASKLSKEVNVDCIIRVARTLTCWKKSRHSKVMRYWPKETRLSTTSFARINSSSTQFLNQLPVKPWSSSSWSKENNSWCA